MCFRYIMEVFSSMSKELQEDDFAYILGSDWLENIKEFRLFQLAHEWLQHNKVSVAVALKK